jgi:alkaline phosphatase D
VDFALGTVLNGLVASVSATAPGLVRIRAWPVENPSAEIVTPWASTNRANAATIALSAAASDGRAWAWRGEVRDASAALVATHPARYVPARARAGPTTFTFAFGSCILQKSAVPTLRVARSWSPVFLAVLGDLGYQDNPLSYPDTQNYAGYSAMFKRILRHPDLADLLARAPFYGMQDDHDYGKNDADRTTVKAYAAEAYADLVPGASWSSPAYRRWSIGDVDFFLTDNRRHKDPRGGPFENGLYMSVLGTNQREWLLSALASSAARVKVVFIPMTMAWYWSTGEKAAVRRFINQNVGGTVIFLSGDKHAGGFARWPDRIWEMLAGPLRNPGKHRTPSAQGVIWTENGTDKALYDCIGVVSVDTRTTGTVTLRLLRDTGVELHREVISI